MNVSKNCTSKHLMGQQYVDQQSWFLLPSPQKIRLLHWLRLLNQIATSHISMWTGYWPFSMSRNYKKYIYKLGKRAFEKWFLINVITAKLKKLLKYFFVRRVALNKNAPISFDLEVTVEKHSHSDMNAMPLLKTIHQWQPRRTAIAIAACNFCFSSE